MAGHLGVSAREGRSSRCRAWPIAAEAREVGDGLPALQSSADIEFEGKPGILWAGRFFRILKGLGIIRIVQPGTGVHQQRGRGRWVDRGMLM
jgi:hypothetical protein